MNKKNRPLSPHLSIYKLPLSAKLSILHRFTGFTLFFGTLFICCGVICNLYLDFDIQSTINNCILNQWIWNIILLGWSFSLFYHMLNGIRHLCWDLGYGFKIKIVNYSNWIILMLAFFMTIGSGLIAFQIIRI